MKIFKFSNSRFDHEATKIKTTFIEFLYNEGIINYETYMELELNYAIIIKKPSFFSRFWLRSKYPNEYHYIVTKQCTLSSTKDDEDSKPKLTVIKPKDD